MNTRSRWILGGRSSGICILIAVLLLSLAHSLFAETVGLPPKRFYSLDDIGDITPGFRIGFDPLGRLMVVRYDKLMVLNDNEWINLIDEKDPIDHTLTQVAYSPEGVGYFASHGHWGTLERQESGLYTPVSLSPEARPEWTLGGDFDHILITEDGAFFYNWNGLLHYNESTGKHRYLQLPGLEQVFEYQGKFYVSVLSIGLMRFDMEQFAVSPVPVKPVFPRDLKNATHVASDSILFTHALRGFMVMKDGMFSEWVTDLDLSDARGAIDLCYLSEGNVAVAVERMGILVLESDGNVVLELTGPEYEGVHQIVSNEPGVLWYATDEGVGKIYYGSGVRSLDHRSGLQTEWPEVCRWDKGILISSNGIIFESYQDTDTGTLRFRPVLNQPDSFNLTVAGCGSQMLIGNGIGVYSIDVDGKLESVISDMDVARVVPLNPDLCIVIGSYEITAIRREGNQWIEFVRRIPGLGFPSIVHKIGNSVWIELGLNRAARLTLERQQLLTQVFEQFPWKQASWVNIGSIGETVVLTGPDDQRVYVDEHSGSYTQAPEIDKLFKQSPFPVWRTVQDSVGNIWLSHNRGVSKLRKEKEGYRFDLGPARLIREPSPILRLFGDDELWVSSRRSLYLVYPVDADQVPRNPKPQLVSVSDAKTQELLFPQGGDGDFSSLSHDQNTLSFRFFSGSYAYDNLSYRVDLKSAFSEWSLTRSGSGLTIPNLKEASYRMQVTLMDANLPMGEPLQLNFTIHPPWYRSALAYGIYGFGFVLLVALLSAIPVAVARNRNRVLARLVDERTHELELTMGRLREEERSRAVHEERNRIAHEIHDSVQQGLSGLKLILDSTLKSSGLTEELQRRLGRAKTILTYTHQEVKHAVWDMETPLLKDENLALALERVASLVNSRAIQIEVISSGLAFPLPRSTQHHLLRIAQESITNAIQHGQAQHIVIRLNFETEHALVEIEDDGKGFNVQDVTHSSHQLGLRGVLDRAERFRGTVDIVSEIGKGTRVSIRVPIPRGDAI